MRLGEDEVYQETSLGGVEGPLHEDSLEATNQKHKQAQVDKFYKYLQGEIYKKTNKKNVLPDVINYDRFIIRGKSLDYKIEDGNIMNLRKKNGAYYALFHFKISFIRNELSLPYDNFSIKACEALAKPLSNLDHINAESVPMQDLPQFSTDVEQDFKEAVSILLEHGFTAREVLGLDKALQTNRGELVNNLAKLSEIEREIKDI